MCQTELMFYKCFNLFKSQHVPSYSDLKYILKASGEFILGFKVRFYRVLVRKTRTFKEISSAPTASSVSYIKHHLKMIRSVPGSTIT